VAEGAGQRITVDGSEAAGFLVSIHDGTVFRSYALQAESAKAALAQGLERFDEEVDHEQDGQHDLPPEPATPVAADDQPQLPLRRVERPFDGDPNTLDVTRGRVGDEDPDPDKRPGAVLSEHERAMQGDPVPPGVSEAAPEAGTHTGNDQAVSYEADPAPDGAVVQSSPQVHPDQFATAVVHDQPTEATAPRDGGEGGDGETSAGSEPNVPAAPPASPGEQIEAAEARAAQHREGADHGGEEGSDGAKGG
jgi:hypothetical protein